jgi:fatty-acyl-CoA synthase
LAGVGVPMARILLNSIKYRLDARAISILLSHSETNVLFVKSQFLQDARETLQMWMSSPRVPKERAQILVIEGGLEAGSNSGKTFLSGWGELIEYEELLQIGDSVCAIQWPEDDWETISLNYTSRPKGVLFHHR